MHSARKLVAAALVVVMALALFAGIGTSGGASRDTGAVVRAPDAARGLQLPFSSTSRYVDPALKDATGRVSVLVAMESAAPPVEVARFLTAPRTMPAIGDIRLVRGMIDASQIGQLASSPSVRAILQDRPIPFDVPKKPSLTPHLPMNVKGLRFPEPTAVERESLRGGPEISMRDVVNFTGARRAWTQLGVNGTGVTIAVVDTGVDHGAFNLGNRSTARDAGGFPSSFDPDGSTLAWTTIALPSVAGPGGTSFLPTTGTDPLIYIFDLFSFFPGGYGPKAFHWSSPFLFVSPFPANMNITGLPVSKSGFYRFGVLFEWGFFLDFFPVVVIDSTTAGVYDTAYLDLSFDYKLWIAGPPFDFSFADNEPRLKAAGGNVVAARDMTGDGYADVSAGSLAYGLDIWGLDPTPPDQFMILKPIDRNGDYLTMLYDWNSHGTFVAASAAGRESNHPIAGPGTGPGAKIMGVPIFAWGDIIEGWLWAAGFDLVGTTIPRSVPNYFDVIAYGEWTYTGNHKADIISNSWGVSSWLPIVFPVWPWYDVVTVLEDALMTPGYADPMYPGTLMVHAGGNGAAGYGTMTNPGFNSLAITTGASTNLKYTVFPSAGFHGDVISWSARGPNAYGNLKPDVLQVGAFAWAAGPVWAGFGNGFFAYDLFGGTSQATPVTSGSAAVLIQAYTVGHGGARPSPFTVKSILKSTALDLGYDAFVQGAGHVDVYNAAAYAKGLAGILTTTPASWDNLRPWIASPWASASVFYGEQVGLNPPAGPIPDTSWFAGSVKPGGSTSAQFTIAPATGTVSGSIAAVWHSRLAGSLSLTGTTIVLGPAWGLGDPQGYGALVPLASPIPAVADLMVVRGIMPYNYLDVNGDYNWDNRSRIIVGDWVDTNVNSVPDVSEVKVFNYGYNTGTTVEARVGLPNGRFSGTPLLWFSHVPRPGRLFVPMPFTIQVEFYDRLPWSWITVPSTFTASAASPATWTATLAVPAGTNPGVYEGQIIVTPTVGNVTAVPVSVVVPATIGVGTLSTTVTSTGSTQIYDPSKVNGYFDWRWRYEAGDWKLWFVDVADPTTIALRADVSWTGAQTDVDIWSLRPDAIPSDSSFSPDLGSGRFVRSTRTGTTADWVVASTQNGLGLTNPGIYTFALHNVLLGGGPVPESLTGTVSAAKLSPRSPVTVVTQPGKAVSVPLTLSTGFALSSIFGSPFSPPTSSFPSTIYPGLTPALPTGGSLTMWLNISVPAGAADGAYQNFMFLSASPGVFAIVVVNVIVVADNTAPSAAFSSPAANAAVRGTITVSFTVSDANIASTTLTFGGTSADVTGASSAPVNTATLADGAQTLTLTAVDKAGNSATATLTLNVDNTAPRAVIASPAAGAHLRGSVDFSVVATDTNLAAANLTIGTHVFPVTGGTKTIDTATITDGPYTATLAVVDMAGNVATASVAVTIDNTLPVVAISSPTGGASVRGTVTITWTAGDSNLAQVWLIIDTEQQLVTGTTYSWDTKTVGDGSHTVKVMAVDKAGNVGTASVSVSTDNVAMAVSTGFTNGLLIGVVAAAVAGLLVGWFLGRRRKKPSEAMEGTSSTMMRENPAPPKSTQEEEL